MKARNAMFARMSSSRKTANAPKPRRAFVPDSLNLLSLETRVVQSTAILSQGILTVTGTASAETIKVVESNSTINADGKSFSAGSVNSIVVKGLAGSDTISVLSKKPATLDGGDGDDTLVATSGNDTLIGGAGNNSYAGSAATNLVTDPKLTNGIALTKAIMDKDVTLTGGTVSFLWSPSKPQVKVGEVTYLETYGGAIYFTPSTGAHVLTGDILAKYKALGGPSSFLGAPTTDVTLGKGFYSCDFQGGSIYWLSTTGAHVLNGDILAKYRALGGPQSFLGMPTADQQSSKGLYWCDFQGGSIYWGSGLGAHVLNGEVNAKYKALGGVSGRLGVPTIDQANAGGVYWCDFQTGSIVWGSQTGAKVLYGAIRDKYYAFGGAAGFLGLPLTDQTSWWAGDAVEFQGGTIASNPANTRAFEVHGAIRDKYYSLGGGLGLLGLPITDEYQGSDGWRVSEFQYGKVIWRADAGSHVTLNRSEIIGQIKRSQRDGILDQTEYKQFQSIAYDTNVYVDGYLRNLTQKFIGYDPANATFQGAAVGSLTVNAPAWKVDVLEREWFEGQDRPATMFNRTDKKGIVTTVNGGSYSYVNGPLFGTWGPQYSDIYQGIVGDCSFLATLAETCYRNPSVIQNMFIDNGDSTFTVRFYDNGGTPQYVTVDRMLPSGGGAFARPTAGPIWPALAEKAYAQINESGWLKSNVLGANSYAALDGMADSVSLKAVANLASIKGNVDLASAYASGRYLILDTKDDLVSTTFVPSHAYAFLGYNSKNNMYMLFNPWGRDGGYLGTQKYAGTLYVTQADINANFTSETVSKLAPELKPARDADRPSPKAQPGLAAVSATPDVEPQTVAIRRTPAARRDRSATPTVILAARPSHVATGHRVHAATATPRGFAADWLRA